MILNPDTFERHARALVGNAYLLTVEQVATIAGVKAKTIQNASSNREITGMGHGRARRYELWEVHRWMERRMRR